jgi:hypothetical protein
VCVPTVDGETHYGKLTQIIEVEYYDRMKYILFKCDCANNTRDKGYKVDKHDLTLVNLKNLVHRGDKITDDPYMLTSKVKQVFYIKDDRDRDDCCDYRVVYCADGCSEVAYKDRFRGKCIFNP